MFWRQRLLRSICDDDLSREELSRDRTQFIPNRWRLSGDSSYVLLLYQNCILIQLVPPITKPTEAHQPRPTRAGREDVDQTLEGDGAQSTPMSGYYPNGFYPQDTKTVISFVRGDPSNPFNWSKVFEDSCDPPLKFANGVLQRKKSFVVIIGIVTVINSTLASALPSGAVQSLASHFGITSQEQLVLPISIYLVGYILGPLVFGPLSETYGRRFILIATFCFYTVFTLACALAPNWPALLVFRFFAGVNAACPVSVIGGLYADIFSDPVTRGRAMALFMAVCSLT